MVKALIMSHNIGTRWFLEDKIPADYETIISSENECARIASVIAEHKPNFIVSDNPNMKEWLVRQNLPIIHLYTPKTRQDCEKYQYDYLVPTTSLTFNADFGNALNQITQQLAQRNQADQSNSQAASPEL